MTAMDHTKHDIETLLLGLKPNFVFFDFAHWIPTLTRRLGIKSMHYSIISPVAVAYDISPARQVQGGNLTEHELMQPPQGFPDPSIKLNIHEARANVAIRTKESGGGVSIVERLATASSLSDAIGFKGCREIDGPFIDYLAQFGKCVLLSGPVIPNPPASSLEEKWALWLKGFKAGSVIYCTLGSEFILQLNQFQELLLGLELSGMPFFAALKPPTGFDSVETALPEGFKERIQGRGNVYGGWVQQQLILEHPSVGCYICHCGVGSLLEGLVNQCQLVFLPCIADQIFNARLMANSLKVGVEVEKGEEDGLFTKESVCKAVTTVMDNDNETGREVRANHAKLREILLKKDFETAYIDNFCKNLQDLCK